MISKSLLLYSVAVIAAGVAVSIAIGPPYMDEIFHIPQAQRYCHGTYLARIHLIHANTLFISSCTHIILRDIRIRILVIFRASDSPYYNGLILASVVATIPEPDPNSLFKHDTHALI